MSDNPGGALVGAAMSIALVAFLLFVAAGLTAIVIAFLGLFIAKASGGLKAYKEFWTASAIALCFAISCTAALLIGSLFANVFMDWFFSADPRYVSGSRNFQSRDDIQGMKKAPI